MLFNFISGEVKILMTERYYGMAGVKVFYYRETSWRREPYKRTGGRALTGRGQHSVGGWCSVWEKGRNSRRLYEVSSSSSIVRFQQSVSKLQVTQPICSLKCNMTRPVCTLDFLSGVAVQSATTRLNAVLRT